MSWYDELVGRLSLPEPVMIAPERALPGRAEPLDVPDTHYVNGHPIHPPFPEGLQLAVVAMGCFWGAEKGFWELDGVYTTAVGYVGGYTPNPTYEEVCSGRTGHTEAVLVVFDPAVIDYAGILRHFWENHDPTQGMRQGNDRGTQYRSAVFTFGPEQADLVRSTAEAYGKRLAAAGYGRITTDIAPLPGLAAFYYAEGYHQQYLAKNPGGYCPVHATGVSCPVGTGA
ncbi:peptide-methionine (S)-S-oxide reductase MsrA [Nocardia gamkensis]|jgi:peptide-methionine (S)-S-oxide reductase|uniref:Peptide methionine sulfoxide reductase MsrA n=1 Tax=Nocardia gamkensis TaxID=352869 RepID=A0A7X6L5Q2_9NOCA|nr:peptide-methionine (S)-S-oxide reductase MsrA [Nocardia gamkensis]NKY28202.1 peptide-methionine (S)-S-oxide reductase MsrA [Nocardia gamkensis]NQE70777.1 Peptide methionine sulfoxide reductase MsrA 1 [Nocardia gamkensis]